MWLVLLHNEHINEPRYFNDGFVKFLFIIPYSWNCVVQVSCVANWPLDFSVHISANYHATLNRYISPDELPVCYGGKRSDPDGDPTCKSQASQTKITPH